MDSRTPTKNEIDHIAFWKSSDQKKPTRPIHQWPKESAEKPIEISAINAINRARDAVTSTLPTLTEEAIRIISKNGVLFAPLAAGALAADFIKANVNLVVATEEAIRAGITKLISLVFEKSPEERKINRIFKSFLKRFKDTMILLVNFKLMTAEELNQKLSTGDIEKLVGLTLLHSAYASRQCKNGLLLASGKVLERKDCPTNALELFDKIMSLKLLIYDALKSANQGPLSFGCNQEKNEKADSYVVTQWIKLIVAGNLISEERMPNANVDQIKIVNQIIRFVDDLKKDGQALLPQSPRSIGKSIKI